MTPWSRPWYLLCLALVVGVWIFVLGELVLAAAWMAYPTA